MHLLSTRICNNLRTSVTNYGRVYVSRHLLVLHKQKFELKIVEVQEELVVINLERVNRDMHCSGRKLMQSKGVTQKHSWQSKNMFSQA